MGDIIIEETNYKALVLALASFFLWVAFVALSIYAWSENKQILRITGILASVIFFICFVVSAIKASKIKRLLTITRDGIIINSPANGFGFICYEDIERFQITKLYNFNVIAVIPKNIDAFLTRIPPSKRRQIKRNYLLKLPPISINVDMAKDMEPEDILSLLQKRLEDNARLYD